MLEALKCIEEDREISTLSTVLDPVELSGYLYPVLPPTWGSLREITAHVFHHDHRSRCVVEIILKTTSGNHKLIGKVYAEDRSDVYRAMKQISEAGFGPEAEFSIPQPLSYVTAIRLLLQEKVQGPLAKEVFLQGDARSRAMAAERCARWLAHFHAKAPRSGEVFDLNNYLVSMERWPRQIAALSRSLEDKAYRLLKQLETAAAALDSVEACAGHGSYSHRQIILAENRMATFDWDGYCVADPGHDVARFIIALRRLALGRLRSIRALDAAAEIFQRTYIATGKSGSLAHLPVYEAAICLELAQRDLRKRRQMKVEALIDEGLRILEQDG